MLEGKTVFITGGARGIGLGIAQEAARLGAKLALADIDAAALAEAKASFDAAVTVETYQLDVTDRAAFLEVAERVENELGPVHALFNNAGLIDSVAPSAMKGGVWDWIVDVNLNGVYNGLQAFLPGMIARGEGGYVVNTSSMSGLIPVGSGFAYHATKFAVVGLTQSLRAEVAHRGISVSCVVPGQVATSIVRNTESLRPDEAEERTTKVRGILDAAHLRLQADGVPLEVAGRAVVEGALAGQAFIFTDGPAAEKLYRAHLEGYLAQILGCFPTTETLDPRGAIAQEA